MTKRYLCQTKEEIDYIYDKYYNAEYFPQRITVDKKFEETKNVSFFFDEKFNIETWCNFSCEMKNCRSYACLARLDEHIIVRNWVRERKLERIIDEEIH